MKLLPMLFSSPNRKKKKNFRLLNVYVVLLFIYHVKKNKAILFLPTRYRKFTDQLSGMIDAPIRPTDRPTDQPTSTARLGFRFAFDLRVSKNDWRIHFFFQSAKIGLSSKCNQRQFIIDVTMRKRIIIPLWPLSNEITNWFISTFTSYNRRFFNQCQWTETKWYFIIWFKGDKNNVHSTIEICTCAMFTF